MKLLSKEHYDLMAEFEKACKRHTFCSLRFGKENQADWNRGRIYQNGEVNNLFLVFRHGYVLGKAIQSDNA